MTRPLSTLLQPAIMSFALACLAATAWADASNPDLITASTTANELRWQTKAAHGQATLHIVNAQGTNVILAQLPPGELHWSPAGSGLSDGLYHYELVLAAPGTLLDRARDPNAQAHVHAPSRSGDFSIAQGALVLPVPEPQVAISPTPNDLVTPNNEIVDGNLCVGLDCINNEALDPPTLKLKENNTRLTFIDTSPNTAPQNSWEIDANASASGGANYLGIEDLGAGAGGGNNGANGYAARFDAGAPANALVVAADGKIGIRTDVPALDLHIRSTDTPALRHEQTNAGGFTAQTWDVGANEANFFVRDITSGSRLPFRARPGAPESAVDIAGNGDVGLGTPRPAAALHVFHADGATNLRVEETNPTAATRTLAVLTNQGDVWTRLAYADGADWTAKAGSSLALAPAGGAAALSLDASGNLTLTGTLSQGSSRSLKHDIRAISPQRMLALLRDLPIYTWQYLTDHADVRHLGPMAEDVHSVFAIGESPRALAPGDVAGIAAAATQALNKQLAAKDAELDRLLRRLDALEHELDAQERSHE